VVCRGTHIDRLHVGAFHGVGLQARLARGVRDGLRQNPRSVESGSIKIDDRVRQRPVALTDDLEKEFAARTRNGIAERRAVRSGVRARTMSE